MGLRFGGLGLPVAEADLAEMDRVVRNQRALLQHGSEVASLGIGDDGPGIAHRHQTVSDELVELELLRTAISTMPPAAGRWLTSHTAAATSSAAIG